MNLEDLEADLILSLKHIEATSTKGSEIESFLTKFLIIHIGSEYDKEVKRVIIDRTEKSRDAELLAYVSSTLERLSNLRVSDIYGLLKKFNTNVASKFRLKVPENDEIEIRYGNIIENRNKSAHGNPINMTLEELIVSNRMAIKVLSSMREVLIH